MTVSNEIETAINRVASVNQNFVITRDDDVLEFEVIPGRENQWFDLENIIFDYNNETARITYTLNGTNYVCTTNINDDIVPDFSIENLTVVFSGLSNTTIKILLLVLYFNKVYGLGRGLELLSQNQGNRNFMGINIDFRINEG